MFAIGENLALTVHSALKINADLVLSRAFEAFRDKDTPPPVVLASALPVPMTLGLSIAEVTAWNLSKIQPVAKLWSDALQASPGVQHVLWPAESPDNSQAIQLNKLKPRDNPSSLLGAALELIMSDIPSFLAFAGNGRFVDAEAPTIPAAVPETYFDLFAGLHTFVVSKLMESNGYYATPGGIVADQAAFEKANQCSTASNSGCITRNGRVFYRSPSTHRQYELRAKAGSPVVKLSELMEQIGNQGWAEPQLLFDGNYNCTAAGKAGGTIVNPGRNDTVDVGCVSQLPMYLECGTVCPTEVLVGGKCPFGFTRRC
ncbi:MAG: hypothetical protein Q9219_002379 [cf. Caloplaca sp. 3 TL-2023]